MTKRAFAVLITAALLVGASAGAYKPQCKDSSGRLIVCSGNLDNTQAPTSIAASTLTGTVAQANGGLGVDASGLSNGVLVKSGGVMSSAATLSTANGGTGASAYTANGVVVADGVGTALQSTNAPTTPGQFLLWDGAQWLPGIQTGTVYYFRRDASDIGGGYEQITQSPQTGAEKTDSTTLNNASGTVIFDLYATNAGEPGLTQLLAGTWEFDIYGQVSSTAGGNTTNIVLQVYKRTTGGTETLLFSTTSPALDSTSVKLYSWLYTQPADILLDITDRLVVKVAATNSSVTNRTVTFYYEGTTHYSHFHPPFLSLIDGGSLVTIGGTQTITGAKTFDIAPVMSGANVTSSTLPGSALTAASVATSKITGGTANRVLYDNGTGASWTGAPSAATSFLRGSSPPVFDLVNLSSDTAGVTPTSKGGTNLSSFTAGGVFYASDASSISFVGPGTAGYVLTSNGTIPTMAAPITATTYSASLSAASYTLTTNAFEDIGLSVSSIPAGKYDVNVECRNAVSCSSGVGYLVLRLYDATAGAAIADSERIGAVCTTTTGIYSTTTAIHEFVTFATPSTLRLEMQAPAGPAYGTRSALSDVDGRCRLKLKRIGP